MSLETRKVLDMVAEGKITAADAEKLMAKLEGSAATATEDAPAPAPEARGFRRVRFLRIVVDEPGRKQVNIRMPLAFAFAAKSLIAALPVNVAEKLKERGIDLSQVPLPTGKGESEMDQALQELNLEVDRGDGKLVRIFCE